MAAGTRRPRVAIGGLIHETHGFAPTKTSLADFRSTWYEGQDLVAAMRGTRSGIDGMLDGARRQPDPWHILPTFYAAAMPAGLVEDAAFDALLSQLCGAMRAALPVDGVLLHLHGAMVTESCLDAETEIVTQIRRIVGAGVPIVVELDMHGNINPALAEQADALLAYNTNPHVDLYDRGVQAARILGASLRREIRPVTHVRNFPVMLAPQLTDTDDLPLRALHQRARTMEEDSRVVCISLMGGFAYADTPWTSAGALVVTDGEPELASALAAELEEILMRHQDVLSFQSLEPHQAVRRALEHPGGPVILVDSADNIGGGTPGDGTDALRAMLEARVEEGTVMIADPEAVTACQRAGAGNRIRLAVGGKSDAFHGEPVEVAGEVMALSDGVYPCELETHHFAAFYGDTLDMGDTAWLRVGGVNVLLNARKTPPFDLAQLRGIGIVPERQKMIAVKAAVAYRTAYLPIAAAIIEMDTGGLCTANLKRFAYRHVPRPIFPLDPMATD